MKDSKNLVIGLLCAVVCIMAVAYAAFSTTLTINGTATISSNWNVKITAIECEATAVKGGQAAAVTKSFSNTTAQFNMTFNQPGDTGVCTVTITNAGSLNAKVDKISVVATDSVGATTEEADNIRYSVSGIEQGTTLAASKTNTYVVNAQYVDIKDEAGNSVALTDKTKSKTLTVTIDYVQDFGTGA